MRKLIYDINLTIDGVADHTAGIADDELHNFYTDLLGKADTLLFGRKTYQLMESYWPEARNDPEATATTMAFADKINSMPKIVFSKTLGETNWNKTTLIKEDAIQEIAKLKQQPGKPLMVGGVSLASALINADMVDEYWFLVHPIIIGKGRLLFEHITSRQDLKLLDTFTLQSGVIALHYGK